MISSKRDPASFRDPSGFVFVENGSFYRQINTCYRKDYDCLIKSGLFASLTSTKLLLPHEEVDSNLACEDGVYKVVRPQPLTFVSYPYEWCFSQLKDAALTTLLVQQKALEYGMTLKDSSAFNIQFLNGKPIFIDLLSFQRIVLGQPWVAYRQFCEHFLAPLALASYTDARLSSLLCLYPDGIPLDLATSLLPLRTRFRISLLIHLHLHAKYQKHYADKKVEGRSSRIKKAGLFGLIDHLYVTLKRLRFRDRGMGWGDYYQNNNYSPEAWEHKKKIIDSYLENIKPRTVWDLGANTGELSRLASHKGISTIAFDNDPAAIELNYLRCKDKSDPNLLPLILDVTNPSPPIGWVNRERKSFLSRGPADMVLSLALIHHLAISKNLPFELIAAFFAEICRYLVIEFVPKSDGQVQSLLASREDIFHNYGKPSFERAFGRHFSIKDCTEINSSKRILYLMELKHQCGS